MFPKWIFTRDIIIILLLYFEAICAATNTTTNATKFAGVVKNITVYALRDESYDHDTWRSLKLNISWIPPKEGNKPSSYSVIVTSILRENDTKEECTDGSVLYTVPNTSSFSLLVPQNKILNSVSEVQIHPNCTYRIQVHANPRAKPVGKLPEVIYTVPECIGRKCSCVAAKFRLPVPKVEVTQVEESTIINWNVTSTNSSYIRSYVISIGVPLLISNAGHSVYNITRITNVTSTTNTFIWDSKIGDQYVDVKTGYKIFVAAVDHRGCSGTQGDVTVVINEPATLPGSIIYFLLVGVAVCVILGFVSVMSVRKKNKRSVWQFYLPLRKQRMPESAFKLNQWPHLGHQKFNIDLYKERKSEEAHCSEVQTNEFEVSYKCINLMHELGRGQFGTVYLGILNNNKDTLVAVKMSQCQDVYDEPEARRQLLEEIKMMKAAGSHPNLVSFIGCCTSLDTPVCILLEYLEKGDLLAYLHSRRNIECDNVLLSTFERIASRYANIKDKNKNENLCSAIEKQQFLQFALDIARGMEHLEAAKITHRDLAARNILLTSDLTLKISDFGLSRNGIYVINNNMSKVRRLPLRWMSPEAVRDYAFSSKSDVWSFGIVLWEIGTLGSFPYATIPDDELMHYLTQDKCRLACPDTVSPDIYEIMCSCWNTAPQNRPTFEQLVLDLQILKEPVHYVLEQSMNNPCYTMLSH